MDTSTLPQKAIQGKETRLIVALQSSASCAGLPAKVLPPQCDLLIYAKVLDASGLCFWCLGDNEIFSADRFAPQIHIKGHVAGPSDSQSAVCSLPGCREAFESTENPVYQLRIVHCWIPKRPRRKLKRTARKMKQRWETGRSSATESSADRVELPISAHQALYRSFRIEL
jgi:hypothetical protein